MKHLDLFSGIGGFSLAVDTVWHDQHNEHTFVEWEAFPQAVLRKHWPDAEMHGDIRQFVADATLRGCKGREVPTRQGAEGKGATHIDRCDILTGGFPCQPFSHAGLRKGTEDDRYLWPPMLECISLFRPRWVIAENVAGLASWNDGLVLETVCTDLEKEGYEVQPLIIPAVAVDAPHRRDRIWIIANDTTDDDGGSVRKQSGRSSGKNRSGAPWDIRHREAAPDTSHERCERDGTTRIGWDGFTNEPWQEDWPTAAARLCTVDDGIPGGLVRPRGWRNAALKAAGNAIVPQVAIEIMRTMRLLDRELDTDQAVR